MCDCIALPILLTEKVAVRSICCDAVESKPVPTTGADTGINNVPAPPAVFAGEPTTASEVNWPTFIMDAVVPAPMLRQVSNHSSQKVTLVLATMFRFNAPLVAAMTEPNFTFHVSVPGDVTIQLMRPWHVTLSIDPTFKKFAGRVNLASAGGTEVSAAVVLKAVPSTLDHTSVSCQEFMLMD